MKRLREERKISIQQVAAMVKIQKKELASLKDHLSGDGATAPEIAEAIGMEVSRVVWYLATMKCYGEIVEGAKVDSYFKYKLVGKEIDEAFAATEI